MSFPFNPIQGLIIVEAELQGPLRSGFVRLALDTGASDSLINLNLLSAIGYNPELIKDQVRITTASGIESVPRLNLTSIRALGQERTHFPVIAHTLPPTASIDGLLGLDFLRGHVLNVDFRRGRLQLS